MINSKPYLLVCMLVISSVINSQNTVNKNEIIEQRIEFIGEDNEDTDYSLLFENLFYYIDNPMNLNKLSEINDLHELGLITPIQLFNLQLHLKNENYLMSIYELQAVESFDLETIYRILPFVKVNTDLDNTSLNFPVIWKNSNHELYIRNIRDVEEKKGYSPKENSEDTRYLGSPDKLFLRYRFKYLNKISFGITAEKDQGEEFFKGTQKNGFDYYSAHLFLKNFGKLKQLAIGDYHLQVGQGLTFWSGLAFGKSSDIKSINRVSPGIRQYASADENNFLRGAAVTYEIYKNIELTGFYSSKLIDANITDTIEETQEIIYSSLQNSGFHRTKSELANKDAIRENHYGGRLQFNNQSLKIGITGFNSKYEGEYSKNLQVYNQFDLVSNENSAFGLDYNYILKNYYLFGEITRSKNGAIANIHGLLLSIDPKFSITALYRNYPKDYQNTMANALSENSKPMNEKGYYIGAEAKLPYNLTFTSSIDLFKFPWLKYQTTKINSIGYELLSQLNYRPNKKFNSYFRYKKEEKEINIPEESPKIQFVGNEVKSNYRIHLSFKITEEITLKNRIEYTNYKKDNFEQEEGYLVYQDIVYKPKNKPYSFSTRYALFDSESFNSRIYAYENDVLYYFYIPAYYKKGSRFYFTARYKYRKKFDFWVRYGIWNYRNQETLFSGLEEVEGNIKSDVKIVFRYLF